MKRLTQSRTLTYSFIFLLFFGLTVLACGGSDPSGGGGVSTVPPEPDSPGELRTWATTVASGPDVSPVPTYSLIDWKALAVGDVVTTNTFGEAELNMELCSGRIYVFTSTNLGVHTCRQGDFESDNGLCLQDGAQWFSGECSAAYHLDTASARVTINGTSLALIYLPERELTLLIVPDGRTTLTPITDVVSDNLGTPLTVASEQFVFTMPDSQLVSIGGIVPRAVSPMSDLAPVIRELGLQTWWDAIIREATEDGIAPEVWPDLAPPDVIVTFIGGLESPLVQEAFVTAVPWDNWAESVLGDPEATLTGRNWETRTRLTVDLRAATYDPGQVGGLLFEAFGDDVFPTIAVTVYYPSNDAELAALANSLVKEFNEVGYFDLTLLPLTAAEAQSRITIEREAGNIGSAIWLTRTATSQGE